jgi:hypothetical protein
VQRLLPDKLDSSLFFGQARRKHSFQSCGGGVLAVGRPDAIGQATESRYRDDDLIARVEVDRWVATNTDSGGLD